MTPPIPVGPLGLNKACELEDFDDETFRLWLAEVFPHEFERFGAGFPRGFEYRKHWEVVMAARALTAGGAVRPDADILGVGAGNEPTIFWLTRYVRRVVATDLYASGAWEESATASMLVDPGSQWPGAWEPDRLAVQHMNALHLDFDDETFDGIFSSSSIEHFGTHADVARSADEMCRVLRPGGVLALSTELRLDGPGTGVPDTLLFSPAELGDLIIGDRPWDPIDPPRYTVSAATRAAARPFVESAADVRRHVAARGEIRFHELDWSAYPQLALEHDGYVWTSVQLALRKRAPRRVGRMPGSFRRAVSRLSAPARGFFNHRFETLTDEVHRSVDRVTDVEQHVGAHLQKVEHNVNIVKDLVANDMHAANETARMFGSYLSELVGAVQDLRRLNAHADYLEAMAKGSVDEVTEDLARVLNFAHSYDGFAAQRGVWFNPPVWPEFGRGDAWVGGVNERIVEIPYMLRAMCEVAIGADVLDVGSSESVVGVELASLGYNVTGIDPRPCDFPHPALRRIVTRLDEWETDDRFDAVVCLSTIEHFGVGAYGQPTDADADLRAMQRLRDLARPGALLVLTTPFGVAAIDELQRTYDMDRLNQLLSGWTVADLSFARQMDRLTWRRCAETPTPAAGERYVALVTARRP